MLCRWHQAESATRVERGMRGYVNDRRVLVTLWERHAGIACCYHLTNLLSG
jgi:hypothetical protein